MGQTGREPFDTYEVFSQKDATAKFESQFSLLAPTPEIALSMAQDNFLRRDDIPFNLVVVKRNDMIFMPPEHRAALFRLDNKQYRQPAQYGHIPAKWRALERRNDA